MAINLKKMRPEVQNINRFSIVDYARKNGFDITYEDYDVAMTTNPHTGNRIKIEKVINTWYELDSNQNEITYGNTFRFAIMQKGLLGTVPSDEEWDEIYNMFTDGKSYMVREEYIHNYAKEHGDDSVATEVVKGAITGKDHTSADIGGKAQAANVADMGNPDVAVQVGDMERKTQAEPYNNRHQANATIAGQLGYGRDVPVMNGALPFNGFPAGYYRRTFTKEQMAEILAGIKRDINVAAYDNINFNPDQMRQIRLAIQDGINPLYFNYPFVPAKYMQEYRLAMKHGVDTSLFEIRNSWVPFSPEQVQEIRRGLENGLSINRVKIYAKPYLDPEAMKEIRVGFQDGFYQMGELNAGNYSAKDIRNIRITLTVHRLLQTISTHVKDLYDRIVNFFNKIIEKNHYEGTAAEEVTLDKEEIGKESVKTFEVTAANIYDAVEEVIEDLPIEAKTSILADTLQQTVTKAEAMERSTEAEPAIIMDQSVKEIIDAQTEFALQQKAFECLKEEYIEAYYSSEDNYNIRQVEFSSKLMSDDSLTQVQKVEIIKETLGSTYGEDAAQVWSTRIQKETEVWKDGQKLNTLMDHGRQQMQELTDEAMEYELER